MEIFESVCCTASLLLHCIIILPATFDDSSLTQMPAYYHQLAEAVIVYLCILVDRDYSKVTVVNNEW